MTIAGRFQRIEALFRAASGLGETECERFLQEQCAGDAVLLDELRGMLLADRRPPGVLDQPAIGGDLLHASLQAHAPTPALVPQRIGAYRIVRLIGEGGMGTVYEAQQDNPSRRVAIKVIRSGMVSRGVARRFQQEAQILGRLQHAGIAQILEAGAEGDGQHVRPFLVMELVHGLTLLEYANVNRLNTAQRIELVVLLCEAVQHAHDHGVIHRDLKPGNIFVNADGQPKILDFGVARATGSDFEALTLHTTTGEFIGTVPYMSPEQASGDPDQIDWRSDVYALGVILFELLTGRLPHEVRDRMVHEALRIIRESDATRLGIINKIFRGDLEIIADKALANDKQRRYQSAAELAADLRRYVANEPITARSPSTLYQLKKFARRNRALVAGVAAGLLLMLAGMAVAVWQAVTARRAQGVAELASGRADLRAAEAMRQAYRATIAAASAALDAHDPTTARQQLMGIAEPSRNWEWRHLYAKLDQCSAFLQAAGPALAVGAASDAGYVVSVASDGRILLTNINTGEITQTQQLGMNAISGAAVSPDGSHVALASGRDVGIAAVNGDGKVRILGQTAGAVTMLSVAPGGRHVAALYGHYLALWNCASDEPPALADVKGYWGVSRFSRDGQFLAVGCQNMMSLIDVASGKVVHAHVLDNAGGGADMSSDNELFITGGADKKVHVVDLTTGRDLETYSGHMGMVSRVAVSPNQTLIASVSSDKTLRIWQRGIDTPTAVFHMPATECRSVQFLSDGSKVVTNDARGEVRLWHADVADPDVLREHKGYVYGLAFTSDGARLISGAWDRTLRIWDTATRECLRVLDCGPVPDPYITCVAISPDGKTLAAGHHKGGGQPSSIRLWNLHTGSLETPLPSQVGEVRALAFSPDGAVLASGRTHAPLTLWNMRNTGEPPELLPHIGVVRGIAWSPDGRSFATTHDDGCIRIWDFATRHMLRELRGHASYCSSCQFSPDGRLIASAADDARLWDVDSGKCLAVLDRHWDIVFAAAFSPDGTRLATGSRDTTIRVWDVASGDEVAQLRGHNDYVYALAFSPDGTMLASASGDATVRLWSAQSAAHTRSLRTQKPTD